MVARDQAYQLRNLVRQMAPLAASGVVDPSPRRIVVTGDRCGVGTTTLAVNLAVAMAQQGRRMLLVDADYQRANVAALCRLEGKYTIGDVLCGERSVREALQSGPAGIQVLTGTWAHNRDVECSAEGQLRLLRQLDSMKRQVDFVVLDIGSGRGEIASRFWSAGDQIVIVTTGHPNCVIETCESFLLSSRGDEPVPEMYAVVNQTDDTAVQADIRLQLGSRHARASAMVIRAAGRVPMDDHFAASTNATVPLLVQSPASPAARSIERLAALLAASKSPPQRDSSTSALCCASAQG